MHHHHRPKSIEKNMLVRQLKPKEQNHNIGDLFGSHNGFGEHIDVAIKLLRRTIEILDRHRISYFLISGTLLGYVRHNGFIPWDDDMDLVVDSSFLGKIDVILEEYGKEICVLNKNGHVKFCFIEEGVEIQGGWSGVWTSQILNNNAKYKWPFIDLFMYDTVGKCLTFFGKEWEANKFFPAKKVNFLGVIANIPKDPEYFLSSNFGGDYMTVFKSSRYSHKNERMGPRSVTINKTSYDATIGISDGKSTQ